MKVFRVFLIVALSCAFEVAAKPVFAEWHLGRDFEITDGRNDVATSAPLVLAMHGFLGNASNMRNKTSFDALARQHGFIVVYPNGKRRRWNDGRGSKNKVDDVGYLTSLINKLVVQGRVDPAQVFLTGHSNGGGMAMRLACEHPELVSAISVVATKLPEKFQCRNGAPVRTIFFHGTEDPISPHGGRSNQSRLGGALSSTETLKIWRMRNRCTGIESTRNIDQKRDGTSVEIVRFSRCAAALTFVKISGHGHDWPSKDGKATRLQGPATKEIDAASVSWRFFRNQN